MYNWSIHFLVAILLHNQYAMLYKWSDSGSSYNLCAIMPHSSGQEFMTYYSHWFSSCIMVLTYLQTKLYYNNSMTMLSMLKRFRLLKYKSFNSSQKRNSISLWSILPSENYILREIVSCKLGIKWSTVSLVRQPEFTPIHNIVQLKK